MKAFLKTTMNENALKHHKNIELQLFTSNKRGNFNFLHFFI